jgi:hypothetical protein
VTDQGAQFTAVIFRVLLTSLGIRQRFGAVGKKGSIALIERCWRTLKHTLRLRFRRPLTKADLQRRAGYALVHYAFCRPHSALGGATPAGLLRPAAGRPRRCLAAARPRRRGLPPFGSHLGPDCQHRSSSSCLAPPTTPSELTGRRKEDVRH